eukprot:gene1587-1842_t
MVVIASTTFFGNADPGAEATSKDPRIGVLLVLLGCLAQGVQYVFEEKVMAVDDISPLVVIGFEGIWGALLSIVLIYPIAYMVPGKDNGSYENPFDSYTMIVNSSFLQRLLLGFVGFVTIYNIMAVYVTRYLSAIWHAILDNFRPMTIWAVDLLLFYYIMPNSGFGEEWTAGSKIQLVGLLILFLGTAVYNGSVMTCDSVKEYTPITDTPASNGGATAASDPSMSIAALA